MAAAGTTSYSARLHDQPKPLFLELPSFLSFRRQTLPALLQGASAGQNISHGAA